MKKIIIGVFIFVIGFIIIQLASVFLYYSAVFPWKAATYKIEDKSNYEIAFIQMSNNNFPNKTIYNDYYILDSFISSFARGHNETFYSVSGPYTFHINAYGSSNEYKKLTINDIKIISSLGKEYDELKEIIFPIELEYKKQNVLNPYRDGDGNYKYIEGEIEPARVHYNLPELDLSFWRNEIITLEYDLTVTLNNGNNIRKK